MASWMQRHEAWQNETDGTALPYAMLAPRETIRQGDIVAHKRLGHVLGIAAPRSRIVN
jgi:hypothetical protein